MTLALRAACAGTVLATSLVAAPRGAAAQVGQLAVGADAALVAADSRDRAFGLGGDLRFGLRTGLPRRAFLDRILFGQMMFQPEAILGYRAIPVFRTVAEPARFGRAGGGLRIGFAREYFEFFATGHAGAAFDDGGGRFLWDVGGALDGRFPAWSLGVHGAYYSLGTRENWFELGPHLEYRWLP